MSDYLENLAVVFINYINRSPDQFRQGSCNGQGYMDLMFHFITHVISKGEYEEDEFLSRSGLYVFNHILDNVPGIESNLMPIIEIVVKQTQLAKIPEYKAALSETVCSCLQYNTGHTLTILE